jgi:hypothetical protein
MTGTPTNDKSKEEPVGGSENDNHHVIAATTHDRLLIDHK